MRADGFVSRLIRSLARQTPAFRVNRHRAGNFRRDFITALGRTGPAFQATPTTLAGALPRFMRTVLAILTVAGLGVVGSTIVYAASETPVGVPTLPTSVAPISVQGDPRAADPCALLDNTWLRQFGRTEIGFGSFPDSCRAQMVTLVGEDPRLYVYFNGSTDPSSLASLTNFAGEPQQLGGVTILRRTAMRNELGTDLCRNIVVLADRTRVYLDAYGPAGFDRCLLAEVGTVTAVNSLARNGITYRPERTSQFLITQSNACDVLSAAELRGVGVDPTIRYPGFGKWSCAWGTSDNGNAKASIYYRLEDVRVGDYGDDIPLDSHRAWLRRGDGRGSIRYCEATVVYRPTSSQRRVTEMLGVRVEGSQPDFAMCDQAAQLARAALKALPAT